MNSIGILGSRITELLEGGFICCSRTSADSIDPLFILSEKLLPVCEEIHTPTLATVSGDEYVSQLKARVDEWNRANPFYKIELRDYSVYGREDNPQGAQMQMAKGGFWRT